jgi:hypothetical protein
MVRPCSLTLVHHLRADSRILSLWLLNTVQRLKVTREKAIKLRWLLLPYRVLYNIYEFFQKNLRTHSHLTSKVRHISILLLI